MSNKIDDILKSKEAKQAQELGKSVSKGQNVKTNDSAPSTPKVNNSNANSSNSRAVIKNNQPANTPGKKR